MLEDDLAKLTAIGHSHFGTKSFEIIKLKGDASNRRIYRLADNGSTAIAVCSDNKAENDAFLSFSQSFEKINLPVPKVFSYHANKNVYMLEDLGEVTLADWVARSCKYNPIKNDQVIQTYQRILDTLVLFQTKGFNVIDFSKCYQYEEFNFRSIYWDLCYFENRFIPYYVNLKFNELVFRKELSSLAFCLNKVKRSYFLYRDFQSRNIMIKDSKLYFIDYQSGRKGALQYDVASLLYDANVNLNSSTRDMLLNYYIENISQVVDINKSDFRNSYYDFVLIRLLQALGAFGFLVNVKNQKQYQPSIFSAIKNLDTIMNKMTVMDKMPVLKSIFLELQGKIESDKI